MLGEYESYYHSSFCFFFFVCFVFVFLNEKWHDYKRLIKDIFNRILRGFDFEGTGKVKLINMGSGIRNWNRVEIDKENIQEIK